jgi:signal transduction histidine kinase
MRQSVGIVIISVCSFGMIEYFANIVLGWDRSYNPILMIGMIGPMGLIMSLIAYVGGRATRHYTVRLIEGIEKVAQGEFDVRLDEEASELYQEVFANFNKMCEELQGVQTLREDFINHFSHEFKTPITSINGFAKVLLEEDVSDEERTQYLEIIASASESERLAELSTNALMVNKLESEQYVVEKAPYALDEQIKQCAILLSPQWMTEVELSRAFEKYFQGDPSRSSRGLGLGLAIAKKIVDLCGGRIEAQSVLGEGSVFTVYLPIRN